MVPQRGQVQSCRKVGFLLKFHPKGKRGLWAFPEVQTLFLLPLMPSLCSAEVLTRVLRWFAHTP
jgi:hypothetical protein